MAMARRIRCFRGHGPSAGRWWPLGCWVRTTTRSAGFASDVHAAGIVGVARAAGVDRQLSSVCAAAMDPRWTRWSAVSRALGFLLAVETEKRSIFGAVNFALRFADRDTDQRGRSTANFDLPSTPSAARSSAISFPHAGK